MRKAILAVAIIFSADSLLAASCQPWAVKIVYPQPAQKKVIQRPKPRPKVVVKKKNDPPVVFSQCSCSFMSGSAEPPKFDEFKAWKASQAEDPRARQKADNREMKQTILDALDGRLPEPSKGEPVELDCESE